MVVVFPTMPSGFVVESIFGSSSRTSPQAHDDLCENPAVRARGPERRLSQMKESCKSHTKFDESWWVSDIKGIPLCRVCDDCIDEKLSRYKPEVTGRGRSTRSYEGVVVETIEEDS